MYLVLSGINRKYIVLFSLIIFLPSCDRSTYEIHMNAFVADAHNNILLKAMDGQNILTYLNHTHSDLEKFKTGGVDLQAFAVWVDPEKFTDKDYFLRADNMISKLKYLCSRIPNNWKIIKSYQDINNNIRRNIMSCMIGIEGGHIIGKDINKIEYLYDRGMRYFGLTSNNSNYIGTSARDETLKRFKLNKMGLTNFGRKVISECNRLGIMVDISHVGEKTFMLIIGILLHGICYDFFFVSGQIYTNFKAGEKVKSAAQGLITLATYGVGMLIGFWVAGKIYDVFILENGGHNWNMIWKFPALFALGVFILFLLIFKNEKINFKD